MVELKEIKLKVNKDFLISLELIKKMGMRDLNLEFSNKNLKISQLSDDYVSFIETSFNINSNIDKDLLIEVNFKLFESIIKSYKNNEIINIKIDTKIKTMYIDNLKINYMDNEIDEFKLRNDTKLKLMKEFNINESIELKKEMINKILVLSKMTKLLEKESYLNFTKILGDKNKNYLKVENIRSDKVEFGSFKEFDNFDITNYSNDFIHKILISFKKLNSITKINFKKDIPLLIENNKIFFILAPRFNL